MNSQQITAVAIKCFAFWLLIQVVIYVPGMIGAYSTMKTYSGSDISLTTYTLMIASIISVGLFATYALLKVSNSILKNTKEPETINKDTVSHVFILQVVGGYFIVTALSSAPNMVYSTLSRDSDNISNALYLFGNLFQLFIGLYLLISPGVWLCWLNKLRGRT